MIFISTIFSKIVNYIISYITLLSISILFIAQLIYYKTFTSFFSVANIQKGVGQIVHFSDTIISMIYKNIIYLLIILLPIIIYTVIKKHFNYSRTKFTKILIMFLVFLNAMCISVLSLDLFEKDELYSPKKLYFSLNMPELSASKYGLLTTFILDINRSIYGFEEQANLEEEEKEEPIPEVEYNVLNIDLQSLIENENNSTIKEIHNFVNNGMGTNKNKYTGIFEGKNLIYILAESMYPIGINEELTPTLYMMANSGFVFNNFYVPTYPTSTAGGEYVGLTGLLTKDGSSSSLEYTINKEWPFSLGNSFKDLGYTARSYHNHYHWFYSRNKFHPFFGYTFKACGQGLKINCKIWPESDLEMVNATYKDYISDEKFHVYYVSVSGHLEYNRYGNMMASKNWEYVKHLEYSDSIKAYIATQIELDKAMERLIQLLSEAGKLENTVIAIVPDHYPYGLTGDKPSNFKIIQSALNYTIDSNFELYRSNFILYNSEMDNVYVDKYSSNVDVLPTLLNLFGIEYDSRMLIGKDILSDYENVIMFANRNWISQYGRYIKSTDTFIPNDGVTVDTDYVKNVNNQVFSSFYFSKKILDSNYYKYVIKDN